MPQPSQPASLFGVIERFLAATALLGAASYALLNAAYVEFLDDFGLRPEDVGIDRLSVLGRAAWVVVFGVAIWGFGFAIFTIISRSGELRKLENEPSADNQERLKQNNETTEDADNQDRLKQNRETTENVKSAARRSITLAIAGPVVAALILGSFFVLGGQAEDRADQARDGIRVRGIGWPVEIVYVRAVPAKVTWVGEGPAPASLHDDDYLYLGRGDSIVAIWTCDDVTLMLRPDDVIVELKGGDAGKNSIC